MKNYRSCPVCYAVMYYDGESYNCGVCPTQLFVKRRNNADNTTYVAMPQPQLPAFVLQTPKGAT